METQLEKDSECRIGNTVTTFFSPIIYGPITLAIWMESMRNEKSYHVKIYEHGKDINIFRYPKYGRFQKELEEVLKSYPYQNFNLKEICFLLKKNGRN